MLLQPIFNLLNASSTNSGIVGMGVAVASVRKKMGENDVLAAFTWLLKQEWSNLLCGFYAVTLLQFCFGSAETFCQLALHLVTPLFRNQLTVTICYTSVTICYITVTIYCYIVFYLENQRDTYSCNSWKGNNALSPKIFQNVYKTQASAILTADCFGRSSLAMTQHSVLKKTSK